MMREGRREESKFADGKFVIVPVAQSPVNGQLLPRDAPQKIEWQERIGRGTTFISVDYEPVTPVFFILSKKFVAHC